MTLDPYCKQTNSHSSCNGSCSGETDKGSCETVAICKGKSEANIPANWRICAWAAVPETDQQLCCSWITNEKEAVCMNGATSCNESDCT